MKITIFVCLFLCVFSFKANADLPITWNHQLLPDLQSLENIPAAMDKNGVSPMPLTLTKHSDHQTIANCHDYLKSKSDGYQAESTFDITMEGYFISRCKTLDFLLRAKASNSSFVPHQWDESSPKELPVCFGEIGGDSGFWKKNNQDTLAGESLSNLPWSSVQITDPFLSLNAEGENRSFAIMATGDINNDGIEDELIFADTTYTQGSARLYESYEVTATTSESPLKTLQQTGEFYNNVIYGCPKTFPR